MFLQILFTLAQQASAAVPPETCDVELINECLSNFEMRFNSCDEDDIRCQCNAVIKDGANCYAPCPQEALTKFIQTYSDGKCANYDPYLSRRQVIQNLDDVIVEAITITPSDPTTTISLSPQEYQSRLEKIQYKENLKSIRQERARISQEAENARNNAQPQGVNKQVAATQQMTSTACSSESASKATATTTKPEQKKELKNKQKNSASVVFLPFTLMVAAFAVLL